MMKSILEEKLLAEKAKRKKTIGWIVAGAAAAAVIATLVPYKVEKEDPETEEGTTKVKVRAISYAVELAVTPDKSIDITLKSPGITKKGLINAYKHIELKKPDDEAVDGGDELDTLNDKDLIDSALSDEEVPAEEE